MSNAYDNFGDHSPDATPSDRGFGAVPQPVPLKPVARSRGEWHTISGVILIILSFISTTFPSIGLGPVLTWLGLFLAGTISLATGSLIRAVLDAGTATK